ncbi:sigma-70 family RNA polymerase sigma factor [Herbaspirillum sp. RTI4]|uniref:sigma-70 family RNA polymerase sigma factor n=1 Tax=Herbaspirillum sp. RTI4 TaxID=3048640 RepID=UPI002AB5248A|nr:sigma-70 family RNA polymerase sigma factor [Herbaspirillum sp. RTI4]MDY7577801.1 sigma-70 family RNA polymerase sigma factor [Herbaspirillum sp. RTI4]MEA9980771.1 sigma-70 family RNA polymerase sigma factor [Herbaspirillum sp. RTI4]
MTRIIETRTATRTATAHPVEERLKILLLAGMEGDAASYHLFLQELSIRLRAFLKKRLFRWQDELEDIVQETLLAVHNGRHTYRSDQPLTAWVYAIARYKLMDFLRARSRHDGRSEPLDDYLEVLADSDEEPADAKRDIDKLLTQLPDRQRLPILHVKLQGMSVVETAQLTGLSESAVKIGIHRGLKALALKIRLVSSSSPSS